MTTLKKIKLVTVFLWVIVLLWLILIFVLSAQLADHSADVSKKVAETIIERIAWVFHIDTDTETITSVSAA